MFVVSLSKSRFEEERIANALGITPPKADMSIAPQCTSGTSGV